MKTRVADHKSSESSTGFFTKIFGCLFRHSDTGVDESKEAIYLEEDEKLFSDPFQNYHITPQTLLISIREDICQINQYINEAFKNRCRSEYTAFKTWLDYLDKHSFNTMMKTTPGPLTTISDLELLQLIACERTILFKFLDQEDVKLARYEHLLELKPKRETARAYKAEWEKAKNIRDATGEFIYDLERTVELIQICNDKIEKLQQLMNNKEVVRSTSEEQDEATPSSLLLKL